MKKRALGAGTALFALMLGAGPALAQTGVDESQSGSDAAAAGEIVVTAQKREQRLQDVGLTVSAIGSEALANQRIASVGDLAKVVAGLNYTPSPNSTPVYTLRGVGFYETSVAAYPDVTTYLDQAPLPLPVMSALTAFDLERVEVLKGPQGTLFGNNATGGAINFIAAKPTSEFHAGAEFGYGRFNTVEVQGYVSGPVSDTLSARLAVKATKGDDWQRSYTRDDTLGEADRVAGRLILDWRPVDGLSFVLNANGWRDKSDPQAPQLRRKVQPSDLQSPIGTSGAGGTVGPDLPVLFYPPAPHDPRAADWTPSLRPFANNTLWQTSLTTNYDLTDTITLTSLTNYVHYTMHNATEADATALTNVNLSRDDARARTFTQELRLANSGVGAPFRWVIGANYDRTVAFESIDNKLKDASTGAQQGFTANSFSADQKMRNIAAFGNVEFDVSPAIKLKGGVRYTDSQRTSVNRSFQTPGYVEASGQPGLVNVINFVWGNIYTPFFCPGVTYKPIGVGDSVSINPATCVVSDYYGKLKEHNVSWSGGVDFKPAQGVLLYANVSKGYKAGSFPTVSAATFAQYAPVSQESVVDYEAGFKAQLGRSVSLNGAAFYYDYKNKQVRGKVVDPLFGILDRLVNIPKSSIKGVEADVDLRPVQGLSIRATAMYLDAKVKRYDGVVGVTRNALGLAFENLASYEGVSLPFAPKFQGSISADYETPLSSSVIFSIGGTLAGQAKSYGSLQLAPQDVADATIPGYATLDLRASIKSPEDTWKVSIWGRNVTNKYYLTNSLRVFDTIAAYTGRPAEYGVTVGWKM